MRDANSGNLRGLNTWFELGLAHTAKAITKALSKDVGLPWVNTVATDSAGSALFAGVQVVPHITDALAARCATDAEAFEATGIVVLDGSRSGCAWGSDRDAPQAGVFGPSRLPHMVRRDYVVNSNDSAWLTNPHRPLTGYPRVVGDVRTERTPRTRMAITAIEDQLGSGRKMSTDALSKVLFDNRSKTGDLAAKDVSALCASLPGGRAPTSGGGSVAVGDACKVLSGWDRRFTPTSAGSLLFNTLWMNVVHAKGTGIWKVPFDPDRPVTTPRTLDTEKLVVRTALGDALNELRSAGIPLSAALGARQYVTHHGKRIPIPGADEPLGVLNMIVGEPGDAGNPVIVHGSSFIQLVTFDSGTCPKSQSLLSYSQSTDPTSPHFADQVELFARGKLVRERFCEPDILATPELRTLHLSSR